MKQLVMFGLVGVGATLTHYLSALFLVALAGAPVLLANLLAYCCAVGVSYFGHSRLTFEAVMTKANFIKFVVVSLSALGLSQLILYMLQRAAWFDYKVNLLVIVCLVPIFSFLMSKFWVYRPSV